MSLLRKVHDWLEVRLGIDEIARKQVTGYLLPRNINAWYSMGSILLVILGLQVVTGIVLLYVYVPDADKAFSSVTYIMNEVPLGWLVRTCHAVGSNMMVAVLFLHMLSVLFMGSYKSPRELNWLSGFVLFNLVLAICLTGNLLPWSQLAFWTTSVTTDILGAVPFLGDRLVELIRGGELVGHATIRRFFASHVALLPLLLVTVLGLHLFFLERIGISTPPFGLKETTNRWPGDRFRRESYPGGIPFFPDYLMRDLAAISVCLALFLAIVFFAPEIFLPPAAFVPADPLHPPPGVKPRWYFLASHRAVSIFPIESIGLSLQGTAMALMVLLPFLDRGREKHPLKRPVFLTCAIAGILLYLALTIWGHYS